MLALTLSLALPLAPAPIPAPPQGAVVLVEPLVGPEVTGVNYSLTFAHPDGGAVSAFTAGLVPDAVCWCSSSIAVRRFADGGDVLWTTFLDVSAPDLLGYLSDADLGAGGELAVLSPGFPDTPPRVDLIGPDGQVLWTTRIEDPNASLWPVAVDILAEGQVAVTARGRSNTNPNVFTLILRVLDGATGNEVGRYESPIALPSVDIGTASMGNDVVATWNHAAGRAVARVAPDGTEVFFALTDVGPYGPGIAATDERVFLAAEDRIAALDAAGSVLWERDLPSPGYTRTLVATAPTEFAVIHGCCWVSKVGADGNALWTHLSNGIGDTYLALAVAPNDELVVQTSRSLAVFGGPASVTAWEWLGSDGTEVARVDVDALGAILDNSSPPAVDTRGNVWFSTHEVLLNAVWPDRGTTVKVVRGLPEAPVVCSQSTPNSSGQVGRIIAVGSADAARDNLTLMAVDLPPNQFTIFLNSRTREVTSGPGGTSLCLGGQINRYAGPGQIRSSNAVGQVALQLSLPITPTGALFVPVLAGETRYFQAWHRDVAQLGGSQLTDAIAVTFL